MNRIKELDGIRGFAILFILLYHTLRFGNGSDGSGLDNFLNQVLDSLWIGVDLFFVLSGYLITRILLKTKSTKNWIKKFYIRRILRIFPLYYFVLAIGLLLAVLELTPFHEIKGDFFYHFFYLFNFRIIYEGWNQSQVLDHFWSLCIEEQFYLIWPILITFLPNKTLCKSLIFIVITGLCVRLVGIYYFDFRWITTYVLPFARFDSLGMGALLAWIHKNNIPIPSKLFRGVTWGSLISLLLIFISEKGLIVIKDSIQIWVPTLFAILSACWIHGAIKHSTKWTTLALDSKPLRVLGKYSYGMYVYHQILYSCFHYYFDLERSPLGAIIIIPTTFVISYLSFNVFEIRFLKLKTHFK